MTGFLSTGPSETSQPKTFANEAFLCRAATMKGVKGEVFSRTEDQEERYRPFTLLRLGRSTDDPFLHRRMRHHFNHGRYYQLNNQVLARSDKLSTQTRDGRLEITLSQRLSTGSRYNSPPQRQPRTSIWTERDCKSVLKRSRASRCTGYQCPTMKVSRMRIKLGSCPTPDRHSKTVRDVRDVNYSVTMYVVTLNYVGDLADIVAALPDRSKWLDTDYADEVFPAFGRLVLGKVVSSSLAG